MMQRLVKGNQKWLYIILHKVDFRIQRISREEHYLMIKELLLQEDIIILNVYATNNRAEKDGKPKPIEVEGEIDKSTTIGEDSNISVSRIDRTTRQTISKNMRFNSAISQQHRQHL